jgi:hypothetical protein
MKARSCVPGRILFGALASTQATLRLRDYERENSEAHIAASSLKGASHRALVKALWAANGDPQ